MTVSVNEQKLLPRAERQIYITERARENDSVLVHTESPEITLQYKLISTTDPLCPGGAGSRYSTVYSILIIKTECDRYGATDETVFIYDVTRSRDTADKLLSMLSRGHVTPTTAKDIIDDLL